MPQTVNKWREGEGAGDALVIPGVEALRKRAEDAEQKLSLKSGFLERMTTECNASRNFAAEKQALAERKELERRLTEDKLNEYIEKTKAAEARVKELLAVICRIESMKMETTEGGGWQAEVDFKGAFHGLLSEMIHSTFIEGKATNCLEISCTHLETNDAYIVTIQRKHGKTPLDLRNKAEAENQRLRAALEEIREKSTRFTQCVTCSPYANLEEYEESRDNLLNLLEV